MNKVIAELKALKIIKLVEFYDSLGMSRQLISLLTKSESIKSETKIEHYKIIEKELIRVYNLLIDVNDELYLDEKDARYVNVFKMNSLVKSKELGVIGVYLEKLDGLLNYVTSRISASKLGVGIALPSKRDSQAAQELQTAPENSVPEIIPLTFQERVKNFMSRPVR